MLTVLSMPMNMQHRDPQLMVLSILTHIFCIEHPLTTLSATKVTPKEHKVNNKPQQNKNYYK